MLHLGGAVCTSFTINCSLYMTLHFHYHCSVPLEYISISDNDTITGDGGTRNSQDTQFSPDTYHSPTSQDVHKSDGSQEFDDYSTVVDAVPDSPPPQLDGINCTIPKPMACKMSRAPENSARKKKVLKKSVSQSPSNSAHPFFVTHTTESAARKMARHHKQQRQTQHASPSDEPPAQHQRTKSDSVNHYSHIVDGLSPVERVSTAFVDVVNPPDDSTSPPAAKKPVAARPVSQFQDDSLATQVSMPEREGYVYSTPCPDGVQNLRRLTLFKSDKPHSQDVLELDMDDEEHPVVRPKSALGLYPLDLTSTNSSPTSSLGGRQKKKKGQPLRSVSVYYNDPV